MTIDSNIESVMADLEDNIARDLAAAAHLRRLAAFLRREDARGHEIGAEVAVVGSGVVEIQLAVRAPAGEVGGVDLVEFDDLMQPLAVETPEPAPEPAPKPAPKPAPELAPGDAPDSAGGDASRDAPSSVPLRWTEDEDATAVRMAVAGRTAREIAAELGRPVPGTQYRIKTKLRARIDAAKGAGAPQQKPQAAPEPAPPSDDFTPEDDARLRGYMGDGLGIGGAAAVLRKPRDVVAARWAELQRADAA